MSGVRYTAEQIAWLRENYELYPTRKLLADAFNLEFNDNRSLSSIGQAVIRLCGLKRRERREFTTAEDAWLTEHYPIYKSNIVRELFVEKFGHETSTRNIITHCNKTLGLVSGRKDFEKGRVPDNAVPIGTERVTQQGYTLVKVDDKKSIKGDSQTYHENWVHKHVLIWEQHHGVVPEDHAVIFLDNDKTNFDINNLCCIPKKYMGVMSRNKWYTTDPEITNTAIKWCELHQAIKDINKGE